MSKDKWAKELEEVEAWGRGLKPSANTKRGSEHLKQRLQQAKKKAKNKKAISVRLDEDVVYELKRLAGEGSYQSLMNRALIEWCEAQHTGGLLKEQIQRLEKLASQVEDALKAAKADEAA